MPVTGQMFILSPLEPMKTSERHHPQGAKPQNKLHAADVAERNHYILELLLFFLSLPLLLLHIPTTHLCVIPSLTFMVSFGFSLIKSNVSTKFSPELELVTAAACYTSFHIFGLGLVPNKHSALFFNFSS